MPFGPARRVAEIEGTTVICTTELLVPVASASRNQALRRSTGVVKDTAPWALVSDRPTRTQPGTPTTCSMSRTPMPLSGVLPCVRRPLMVADVPAGTVELTAWADSTAGPGPPGDTDGEPALADGWAVVVGETLWGFPE